MMKIDNVLKVLSYMLLACKNIELDDDTTKKLLLNLCTYLFNEKVDQVVLDDLLQPYLNDNIVKIISREYFNDPIENNNKESFENNMSEFEEMERCITKLTEGSKSRRNKVDIYFNEDDTPLNDNQDLKAKNDDTDSLFDDEFENELKEIENSNKKISFETSREVINTKINYVTEILRGGDNLKKEEFAFPKNRKYVGLRRSDVERTGKPFYTNYKDVPKGLYSKTQCQQMNVPKKKNEKPVAYVLNRIWGGYLPLYKREKV